MVFWWDCLKLMFITNFLYSYITQCVQKVAAHLCYSTVWLKCGGTWWCMGGEVRKVAAHLQKVLEVMSTSVYTGSNLFNFIRKHFLQICLCLSAQRLSKHTALAQHTDIKYSCTTYHDFCVISSLFVCFDRWNAILRTYCSKFWNSFFSPINFK